MLPFSTILNIVIMTTILLLECSWFWFWNAADRDIAITFKLSLQTPEVRHTAHIVTQPLCNEGTVSMFCTLVPAGITFVLSPNTHILIQYNYYIWKCP